MLSCKGHRGHLKGSSAAGVSKTPRETCLFLVRKKVPFGHKWINGMLLICSWMDGDVWFINYACDDGQINSPNTLFNPSENTSSYQPQVSSTFMLFLHKHARKANMCLDKPAKIRLFWNIWEVICRICVGWERSSRRRAAFTPSSVLLLPR